MRWRHIDRSARRMREGAAVAAGEVTRVSQQPQVVAMASARDRPAMATAGRARERSWRRSPARPAMAGARK
jgi:hypothetical protein